MKTAVSVLQEMMMKIGVTPEYECITQSGPMHQSLFEYKCGACGEVVTAAARSKKEAKQEVARLMLKQLSLRGHNVPPPYGSGAIPSRQEPQTSSLAATDTRSYVALLKELCEEYRLGAAEYELVGDTGPPHMRHFTVSASLGMHARMATATTKKAARQIAAEQLYSYLRENLSRVTRDFVEEDALVRAVEKARDRYVETSEDMAAKIDLGIKIADYHLGLATSLSEEARVLTKEALEATRDQPTELALTSVACSADLELDYYTLEADDGDLVVIEVSGCSPSLTFAGKSRSEAAAAALRYMRLVLRVRS